MTISRDEAKQLLVSLLPAGSDQLYDLANTAVIGGTLYGLAGALKQVLLDRIEQLHLELNPSTMTEKIPDWESACGLTNTPIARFGTLDQRRNAVLAVLRTSGSFSYDDIRAIVQPYFLYQDPSQIVILETSRAALRTAHTYSYTTPESIPAASSRLYGVIVPDSPRVSPAGAHLLCNLTGYVGDVAMVLGAPDGTLVSFPAGTLPPLTVTAQGYDLCAPGFAGKAIKGTWTLGVRTASAPLTLNSWAVFVEGLGVIYDTAMPPNRIGQGLGAPMFEFAVFADPALLGTGYDLVGAQRSITRWKPAHTQGFIATANPMGGICAIPDTTSAIPDIAFAC